MLWDQDRTEQCVKLWNDGYSASQVAAELGNVSRNAVIGKLHRLGLAHSRPRSTKHATVRPKRKRPERSPKPVHDWLTVAGEGKAYVSKRSEPTPLPPEPPKPSKLFKLVDLEDNQCRFPFGDPKSKDFGFCGCVKSPGSSYCPGHQRLASTAPNVKVPSIPIEWNYQRKVRVRVGTVERERVE